MAEIPSEETAIQQSIRCWSNLADLDRFACERHGFGDSDGGFGVTYPNDLDEHDREVDGIRIPPGHLIVYGFWGPPDGYELIVRESVYLKILGDVLQEKGLAIEAEQVRFMQRRLDSFDD
jgi:hypothetical protein